MKNKIFILVGVLFIFISGCGNNGNSSENNNGKSQEVVQEATPLETVPKGSLTAKEVTSAGEKYAKRFVDLLLLVRKAKGDPKKLKDLKVDVQMALDDGEELNTKVDALSDKEKRKFVQGLDDFNKNIDDYTAKKLGNGYTIDKTIEELRKFVQ